MSSVPTVSPIPTMPACIEFDGSNWIARLSDEQGQQRWASRPCSSIGAAMAELAQFTGKPVSVSVEV